MADAPYRETNSAIEKMKQVKVDHIVEMEADALYSFAIQKIGKGNLQLLKAVTGFFTVLFYTT